MEEAVGAWDDLLEPRGDGPAMGAVAVQVGVVEAC